MSVGITQPKTNNTTEELLNKDFKIATKIVLPRLSGEGRSYSACLEGKVEKIDNNGTMDLSFYEITGKEQSIIIKKSLRSADRTGQNYLWLYKKELKGKQCFHKDEDISHCYHCSIGSCILKFPSKKKLYKSTKKEWDDRIKSLIKTINVKIFYDVTSDKNLSFYDEGLYYTKTLIQQIAKHYFKIEPLSINTYNLALQQQPPSITNHEEGNLSTAQHAPSPVNNTQDDYVPPISPLQTQQPDAISSVPQPAPNPFSMSIKNLLCHDQEPASASNPRQTTSKNPRCESPKDPVHSEKPSAKRLNMTPPDNTNPPKDTDSQATITDEE
jgi:hypothetical protein